MGSSERFAWKVGGRAVTASAGILALALLPSSVASAASGSPVASGTTGGASSSPSFAHDAEAYGSTIKVGSIVSSGETALVPVGCTLSNSVDRTNSAAALDIEGVSVGVVTDNVATAPVAGRLHDDRHIDDRGDQHR